MMAGSWAGAAASQGSLGPVLAESCPASRSGRVTNARGGPCKLAVLPHLSPRGSAPLLPAVYTPGARRTVAELPGAAWSPRDLGEEAEKLAITVPSQARKRPSRKERRKGGLEGWSVDPLCLSE